MIPLGLQWSFTNRLFVVRGAILACVLSCGVFPSRLRAQSFGGEVNQTPTVRSIDLGRIGYEGLPSIARSSANLSLDFVDDNHVLFTFNPRGLVRRLPECPLTHQDHLIHAVLLEVPSGKVVKQADWYLHDTDRYLWPLGPGRFLLKKLNRLYVIDSSLQEKLLLDSPEEILWVSVTPDGRQIILERDGQPEIPQPDTQPATAEASKAKATVEFLDADSLAVQTSVGLKDIVRLEGTSFGYADVKHARRDDVWLVRFGPSPEQRHNITRIRSHCTPNVSYASNNTLLVGRCSWSSRDYNVTAFSTTGRRLWKKQWEQNRYNPAQKRNADGSRFAISTLKRSLTATDTAPPAGVDSGPSLDALRDLEQEIQVFDTASGTAVLTAEATPVVLDAQNFSLSPDGQQLAVLRDNKIEIHGLSRMAEDEKAKYAAVTKDGLGPYLFDTKNEGPDSAGQEALVQGQDVDEEEMAADGLKAALATPAQPQDGQTSADPIAAQIAGAKNPESTPPADGQEKPSITIRASTQVVAVDVVVTDNKGRPVSGLRAEDFQIAENGKRQNVNYFREVAGTEQPATSPRPAADMLTKLPPNVFTNQTSAEQEEGSLTVILLDLLNTQPMDREHGRDALLKFLKNKKPINKSRFSPWAPAYR